MSDGYVMLTKREYDALRARAIIAEATVDELENHHAAAKMRLTEVDATLTGTQVALDWRIKERDALAAELAQWRGNYQTLLDDSVTIRARIATLEAALRTVERHMSELCYPKDHYAYAPVLAALRATAQMSEPRTFTKYEDWQSACQRAGFEGPYQISGQPHLWQYVAKGGATAALFNYAHGKGFVFDASAHPEASQSDTGNEHGKS
jgi:hypothetical protein